MGPAYWILNTAVLVSLLFLVVFFSYYAQKVQQSVRVISALRNRRIMTSWQGFSLYGYCTLDPCQQGFETSDYILTECLKNIYFDKPSMVHTIICGPGWRLATGWTVRGSNRSGGRDFLFTSPIQIGPGCYRAFYEMGTGAVCVE